VCEGEEQSMEFGTIWDGFAFFSIGGNAFLLNFAICGAVCCFFDRFMVEFAPIFAGLPA